MPHKHQDQSYRTWSGERWVSWCDLMLMSAHAEVQTIRDAGGKARKVKIGHGMYRVFVPHNQNTAALIQPITANE